MVKINDRWEDSANTNLLAVVPVVQQGIGALTIASSLVRGIWHLGEVCVHTACLSGKGLSKLFLKTLSLKGENQATHKNINRPSSSRNYKKLVREDFEKLGKDAEGVVLGFCRITPLIGSFVSLIKWEKMNNKS